MSLSTEQIAELERRWHAAQKRMRPGSWAAISQVADLPVRTRIRWWCAHHLTRASTWLLAHRRETAGGILGHASTRLYQGRRTRR